MSFAVFLTLSIILVSLVYFYFKKKFLYFKERGFLYAEPEFPFGSLKGVGFSIHVAELSKKLYDKFKNKAPAIGLFFFTQPVVFLTDLDLIKNVLIKDFNTFHDHGVYVNKEADPLSGNLFGLEGDEWRKIRNKLSPTFTSGRMKLMFDIIHGISQEMINILKDNEKQVQETEMKDLLTRFTTDVIGNVAFGLDINSMRNPDNEFYKMGQKVVNPPKTVVMKVFFLATFKDFSKKCNFRLFPKEISDFFFSSILQTIEYRESNGIVRNDFFDLLLELKNHGKLKDEEGESSEKLTVEELTAQAFVFFLAGFETSSTTMAFALYELALNQDIQMKLRSEIKDLIARKNGIVSYEAMMEMKYLDMVVNETLRMYCPLDSLIRIAGDDYKIPGTSLTIEKDNLVLIPVYAIQHCEDNYSDTNKFNPERFSERNKASRHPMAYMPFGAGNRNCIGMRFGLMVIKIGLMSLLLNFKFAPSNKTTIPMKFQLNTQLLTPRDKMWLNVEKI